MSGRVGIFRLHLFKLSETFISNQVSSLQRYLPTYIGRKTVGPIPENISIITQDGASISDITRIVFLRSPRWEDEVARLKLDLIHAHFAIDAVYALLLAERVGCPLITTIHGLDATRSDASFLFSGRPALMNYALFGRQLKEQGARFLCVSDFIRQQALRRGYPPERTLLHYIGIDTSRYSMRATPGEDGLVVHVGRLVEKKGTLHLIRAMERVRKHCPQSRLIIIGDGPLKFSLVREAEKLGLGGAVSFLGALPNHEVLQWIRRAAVLAVPSVVASNGDTEGLPTVVLEAASQGVPVVGSDSGGIAEALKDNVSGFVVPEGDPTALADRICRLLSDEGMRFGMGQEARLLMGSSFDLREQSRKLEDFYDSVVQERV